MQVQRRDGSVERRLLIGMIVNPQVLGQVLSLWTKDGLFKAKWSNLVGGWCIEHYKRYGKPPRKQIVGKFEAWAEDNRDQETINLVEKFLESLSDEYSKLNKDIDPDVLLDEGEIHFNRVRAERLRTSVGKYLEVGKIDKAIDKIQSFSRVEVRGASCIDLLTDFDALDRAFEMDMEPPMVKFDGAVGEFYKQALKRHKFVAYIAVTKTGKTRQLLDLGWRALEQGRKVAYFAIGDETDEDMILRFASRISKRPRDAETIQVPTSIEYDSSVEVRVRVQHDEKPFEKPLSKTRARKLFMRAAKLFGGSIRISYYPSLSVTVDRLASDLDSWERQGWGVPDVCIIDYADNLGGFPNMEGRDSINATWQKMRGLSQERPMLVITATQSDAASYDTQLLKKRNFTNDRRKMDHVTGMVGINQSEEEKELQVQRLNWIVLRKGKFLESNVVYCAGCPAIENPCILSTY